MKTLHKYIIILSAILYGSGIANALTGGSSSNDATDVNIPDSTSYYQEESDRAELLRDVKVIFMNGDKETQIPRDSIEKMLAKFYVDQFRNSLDPEAPLFTLMTKDANYSMGIGGIVNVTGWFDWNGIIPGNDGFVVYKIPIPKTPENMKGVGASAAGSRLFFNIIGRNTPVGLFRAYIEAGFNGYNNSGFRLRRAWIQVKDFTVGLAKSTFSDPAAEPPVLDAQGTNGKPDKVNVLARYMRTWKNRWSVGASIEFASSSTTEIENVTKKVHDYVPDFAALGQFQWNRGFSHVRLAGLLRNMAYRDLIHRKNQHVAGWGVELSSVVRAGNRLTFYGLAAVGKGIASYSVELAGGIPDLLPDLNRQGELYAPTTLSGTFGVKVQILPKLSSTVALSTLRLFAKENPDDDSYKYGQYLSANLVYAVTHRLQVGAEYLAGKRMNFNHTNANANRAQISCIYSF